MITKKYIQRSWDS